MPLHNTKHWWDCVKQVTTQQETTQASQGSVKSASIIVCYQSEHKWHEILITKNVTTDFSKQQLTEKLCHSKG